MKKITSFVITTLLTLLTFTGCSTKSVSEPVIAKEYVYINCEIPPLPSKFDRTPFSFSKIELNGVQYYVLTEEDAISLSANWILTKSYINKVVSLIPDKK